MEPHKSFLTGIECVGKRHAAGGVTEFDDPVCGRYGIGDQASEILKGDADQRTRIANVLASRKRRGQVGYLLIIPDGLPLPRQNTADVIYWSISLLQREYPRSVLEILDECLINLSIGLAHPSELPKLDQHWHWWFFSPSFEGAEYFLLALESAKKVAVQRNPIGDMEAVTILTEGWTRLDELRHRPVGQRNQAFVAMWFDDSTEPFFKDGILPAVEADGTKCQRIDLKEHNNKICDEIIAEIRRSKYLVADFTGNRGGVYYEAGFAHGLGIPVIWTVHADEVANLHFDTRQYAHIKYTTPEELKGKLLNRIRATIT